jgi:hypothetical protein
MAYLRPDGRVPVDAGDVKEPLLQSEAQDWSRRCEQSSGVGVHSRFNNPPTEAVNETESDMITTARIDPQAGREVIRSLLRTLMLVCSMTIATVALVALFNPGHSRYGYG